MGSVQRPLHEKALQAKIHPNPGIYGLCASFPKTLDGGNGLDILLLAALGKGTLHGGSPPALPHSDQASAVINLDALGELLWLRRGMLMAALADGATKRIALGLPW